MNEAHWDLSFVREVHQALRCYRNELNLARSPLLALLDGTGTPLSPLERAIALRALLHSAISRLIREDETQGTLLRLRFVDGRPVRELELQGWARSTLFRYLRRAIVSLARILIERSCPPWGPGSA